MKANVRRGGGFAGLLRYALDRGAQCRIVGGNLDGRTPAQLAREFGVSRKLRRDVRRPVWHTTLSLPPGEVLTAEAWNEVTRDFMNRMGLDPDRHQYVVVEHTDTHCNHVHVIASRIGLDGSLWYGVNDALVAQAATQEIEKAYGLTITKGPLVDVEKPGSGVRAGLRMSQDERELWAQREAIPPKAYIAQSVELAIARSDGSVESLRQHLATVGIEARVSTSRGRVAGISYAMEATWDGGSEAVAYKGSKIGARCDAPSIERRLADRRVAIEQTAAVLRHAEELRFEHALRATNPERLARLITRLADIRRDEDAADAAATRDRDPGDARFLAAGDTPGRQEPAEPADAAGLRPPVDAAADREGRRDDRQHEGNDTAATGPHASQAHRADASGGGGPADTDRAPRGADQNRHDRRAAGEPGQQDVPDGTATGDDRAHADRRPPPPQSPHPRAQESWASLEVGVAVGISVRVRRRHTWFDLARRYRAELSPEVARRIRSVRTDADAGAVQVRLEDGTRIVDTGDRITGFWSGSTPPEGAAAAMADMARVRGWSSVRITGDAEFLREAWLACQRAGIAVSNYDPPADLAAQWEAEAQQTAKAVAPVSPPPDPDPPGPDPWAGYEATGESDSAWFMWVRTAKVYRINLDPAASALIRYVRSNKPAGPITVGLRDGTVVEDSGQKISTAWREAAGVSTDAVTVMTEMAKAKGWKGLRIRGGTEEFKRQAWLACQRAGLVVHDYDPPADLVTAWDAETTAVRAESSRHHGENSGDGSRSRSESPITGGSERDRPGDGESRTAERQPGYSDPGAGADAPVDDRVRGASGNGGERQGRAAPGDDQPDPGGHTGSGGQDRYHDFTPLHRPAGYAGPNERPAHRNRASADQQHSGRPEPTNDLRQPGNGRAARGASRTPSPGVDEPQPTEAWDARFRRNSAKLRNARQGGQGAGVRPPDAAVSGKAKERGNAASRAPQSSDRAASDSAAIDSQKQKRYISGPALPYQLKEYKAPNWQYLREIHKIPPGIIDKAEKAKFLHHCANGVAFLGMNAERTWAITAWLHPRLTGIPELMEKSEPSMPPVFYGDPQRIVLCSDGITALRALKDADRDGRNLPTVLALYGSRPENVLRNLPDDLRGMISRAESVTSFGIVNTRAVAEQVQRMQLLHDRENEQEAPISTGPNVKPH